MMADIVVRGEGPPGATAPSCNSPCTVVHNALYCREVKQCSAVECSTSLQYSPGTETVGSPRDLRNNSPFVLVGFVCEDRCRGAVCKVCDLSFESTIVLLKHASKQHNYTSEEKIPNKEKIHYKLNCKIYL